MVENQERVEEVNSRESTSQVPDYANAKWLDNEDKAVENVFGFNKNAELVNSRAAMVGCLMLVLTELIFGGKPVTLAIFGIN